MAWVVTLLVYVLLHYDYMYEEHWLNGRISNCKLESTVDKMLIGSYLLEIQKMVVDKDTLLF